MLDRLNALHATRLEPTTKQIGCRWKLDLRDCPYLGPWAAALICAAYLDAQRLGQRPRVLLPTSPPALAAFCTFSGMAKMFTGGPSPDADHPQCETIPVEQFADASWDRSNRIIKLLQRHTNLTTDTEDQIRTCVQEVSQNIVDHADSAIGGVMTARYLSHASEVRVGIIDHGIGILARLRQTFKDTTTTGLALHRVIGGGYSSRSRPNNMGLGVSNLFQLVRTAGGRMALYTERGVAETLPGMASPQIRDLNCDFPGTGVFFTLPVPT